VSEPRLLCGVSDGRNLCGRPVNDVRFGDSFPRFVVAECRKHGRVGASGYHYEVAKERSQQILHLTKTLSRRTADQMRELFVLRNLDE
jgi:hypothetical protein